MNGKKYLETIMNMNDATANESTIREAFGRIVYTHKAQMKEYELQTSFSSVIKWLNIILTATTSTTLLSTVFFDQQLLYISTGLSFLSLVFVIFQLSFDPAKNAENHKSTADDLWKIREDYLSLLSDIHDETIKVDEIKVIREALKEKTYELYKAALPSSRLAYFLARKSLKMDEEFTFDEKEINIFLPKVLHRK